MTEKAKEHKAPNPAVVEKAEAKREAGDDLNQREAAALEAQRRIDEERGYRRIEWRPGVWLWQSLATQHTTEDETEMIRHINEERVRRFEAEREG